MEYYKTVTCNVGCYTKNNFERCEMELITDLNIMEGLGTCRDKLEAKAYLMANNVKVSDQELEALQAHCYTETDCKSTLTANQLSTVAGGGPPEVKVKTAKAPGSPVSPRDLRKMDFLLAVHFGKRPEPDKLGKKLYNRVYMTPEEVKQVLEDSVTEEQGRWAKQVASEALDLLMGKKDLVVNSGKHNG